MSTAANPSSPARATAGEAASLVLSRREGPITRITLNRPRAINALNLEMYVALEAAVATAQGDGSTAIILDGAGERGFCGGGDIRELAGSDARSILAVEYRLDHAIANSTIPVVGFMDGVTMGGGIGLTGHADHRVVTERSRLAMPEARIGIAPDVGGNLLLANAHGRLGDFLAATAAEMTAGDAIALGFADVYVPSDRLEALAAAIVAGETPEAACARFSEPAPNAPLLETAEWWEPLVTPVLTDASTDPKGTLARLLAALDASARAEARETAAVIRALCPTSVAVALAQIERTRRLDLDLAAVLADDLRVIGRLAARPDFAEGVRAQIIDKDRNPSWDPATVAALQSDELARILSLELRDDESPLAL